MSSEGQDWSALASHNERVVEASVLLLSPGAERRMVMPRPAAPGKARRLRLRRRAAAAQRC
jgi:hypothetical protein